MIKISYFFIFSKRNDNFITKEIFYNVFLEKQYIIYFYFEKMRRSIVRKNRSDINKWKTKVDGA